MFEWETLSSTAARNRPAPTAGNGSDGAQSSIVLGPRDRLVGQLYVEGDLRVAGTVEGGLEVTGSVEIDDGGRVTGPVTARDRLVVGRSGSLMGDVRVARLVVQDGATFSGKVSMGKQVEAASKAVEASPPAVEAAAQIAEPVTKPVEQAKAAEPTKAAEPVKPARAQQATKPSPPKGKRR
jgi:cytoskeletal protein CcmA (bactofilin family)